MAKKQMSFAEKAAKHKARDWKSVKYVKSERSTKTGSWRFNETYVRLAPNENIDQAITRLKKEVEEMAREMASIEESAHEAKTDTSNKAENIKSEEITDLAETIDDASDETKKVDKVEEVEAKSASDASDTTDTPIEEKNAQEEVSESKE